MINNQANASADNNFDEDVGMSDVTPQSQSPIATPVSKSVFATRSSTAYSSMTQGSGDSKLKFSSIESKASLFMNNNNAKNPENEPKAAPVFSIGIGKQNHYISNL